ncbi:spore germination protein [Alkalibacillus haloalkaliphilus]|uniref:Putative spore germination protein GerPA n=1 Tax=Alkalibacillus haloalkaliphilus TaxID=94136 RepID=A0A511W6I5_9BACI|nr:spore germination protein [Alkalibacillus haloalkaliphilus]GEN45683.1 putative spore germination protein GerPA [Alkalibacillus haloalkaliphilus]
MPAFVGAVNVVAVDSSSTFQIGDTYMMQPMSSAKTFAGGGSFNTGQNIEVELGVSNVYIDPGFLFEGGKL